MVPESAAAFPGAGSQMPASAGAVVRCYPVQTGGDAGGVTEAPGLSETSLSFCQWELTVKTEMQAGTLALNGC